MNSNDRPIPVSEVIEIIEWYERLKGADKEQTMSDDLIKRSDAIKALRKLGHEVVVIDKVCSLGVAAEFIDVIRAIPSADLNAEFAEWAKLWFKKELEADRSTITTKQIKYFDEDEQVWKIGSVIVDE